jgi:DNA/RNA endonuclease YhcR with UshA esterase domain
MLKDGGKPIEVFAGPTVFLQRQAFPLAKGDAIEVTGSRVTFNGTPALLARQIKKGDTILILRDENGRPVWAAKARE